MTTETLFLQPVGELPPVEPLFVETLGEVEFFNFNLPALSTSTDVVSNAIVVGGTSTADAEAFAFDLQDPAFSVLETAALGLGEAGSFRGDALGEALVVSTFEVAAHQMFSFDFLVFVELFSKEIDDPTREFARAESDTAFAILNIADPENPILLDEFKVTGTLFSSDDVASLSPSATSDNISLSSQFQNSDIGFDNGIDLSVGTFLGTYSRKFSHDAQIAVVKINTSSISFAGDYLLGNLGQDVDYGTIYDDRVWGTRRNDKIYGSHGDDRLFGLFGHDILEGGWGDDILKGGWGKDKLHGSDGDDLLKGGSGHDILVGGTGNDLIVGDGGKDLIDGGTGNDLIHGGKGNDVLTGGEGSDTFQFRSGRRYQSWQLGTDLITDFEIGTDKIALSRKTFRKLSGTIGSSLNTSQFATVTTDAEAARSSAIIVFNSGTGDLFYNPNGIRKGLRDGGHFASIEGGINVSNLSASDFVLMA